MIVAGLASPDQAIPWDAEREKERAK